MSNRSDPISDNLVHVLCHFMKNYSSILANMSLCTIVTILLSCLCELDRKLYIHWVSNKKKHNYSKVQKFYTCQKLSKKAKRETMKTI